mgnify:CR=1 FL=1
MTTKSDRNLTYVEAVSAGLMSDYDTPLPMIKKRASDWDTTEVPSTPTLNMTTSLQKQLAELDKKIEKATVDTGLKTLMTTEAVKADIGKLDWSLVPFEALEGMVEVLEFGAKKYSAWNWTTGGGFMWTRLVASTLRHLFAFARGEDLDPESGLSHISHGQCNLLFLAYYIRNKNTVKDNRRKV